MMMAKQITFQALEFLLTASKESNATNFILLSQLKNLTPD
jgi:hypothetical protein